MEQDKDIIPETVIKFLQTVLTGKTDYSQPLNIVEQPTNCRHWWQDQTTKTHHVSLCGQVSDWEYRSDAYHVVACGQRKRVVSWKVDVFLELVNSYSSFPFDDRVPTQLCE